MTAENGGAEKITLVGIEVENYRRITAAQIKLVPSKGLVRVTGANAAGKTSLLKAIAGALGGQGQVHRDSLHEGAENGRVTLHLSNGYTVERRLSEASPKGTLVVTGPDEGKHKQGKLNDWLGERSFDPLAFLSLDDARQREVLFSIGTDPDLSKNLDRARGEYQTAYGLRTPLISRRRHLKALEEPEGERPQPVDTSEEMRRLGELQAQERDRGDAFREAEYAADAAIDAGKLTAEAKDRVEHLTRSLAEAQQEHAERTEQQDHVGKEAAQNLVDAQALPDPTEAMDEVKARLEAASEIQTAIEPWTRWDKAQDELAALKEEESKLTDQLGALKRLEADLLAKAGIPVEGLSFGEEGEIRLKGQPLALASGGDQMDFAVDVAFAADQDLGVCLLDEGNDYDLKSLERLHKRALAKHFQVWLCRIGIEGRGEVVVENGQAFDAQAVDDRTLTQVGEK